MLILVSWLYTKGSIDFSGVLIPIIALMSSFGPVVALANLGSTLQQTFASGERILKLLDEKETISEVFGKKDIDGCFLYISNMSEPCAVTYVLIPRFLG